MKVTIRKDPLARIYLDEKAVKALNSWAHSGTLHKTSVLRRVVFLFNV